LWRNSTATIEVYINSVADLPVAPRLFLPENRSQRFYERN
jgi:hypothetical protein